MKHLKSVLFVSMILLAGSAMSQTTSTIMVNDTTIVGASSLADAIKKAGIIDSTKVTSIRYIAGALTGTYDKTVTKTYSGTGDWATLRTLANLRSLITDSAVTVTNIPSYEFYNQTSVIYATETYILCPKLTTVKLATVKAVGQGAFTGMNLSVTDPTMRSLKTVELPQAVTVSNDAFYYCDSLTSVMLPNVVTLGDEAFLNCFALEAASLPEVVTIGESAFSNCKSLKSVSIQKAEILGDNAFCKTLIPELTSEVIPRVRLIGSTVFSDCYRLKTVNLPNVYSVGKSAFLNCPITTLNLPNVTVINGSFQSCFQLTNVNLPEVLTIGANSFLSCYSLASVNCPKATFIGDFAFSECASLNSVALPKAKSVGWNTFKNDSSLKTINFPELTVVGREAFTSSGVTSVSLPKVTVVRTGAFGVCKGLKSITLPEADSLETGALANTKLTTVVLPKITYIGENAFYICDSLVSVSLPAAPPKIDGNDVFPQNKKTCYLYLVDSSGKLLSGDAYTTAYASYKKGIDTQTKLWHYLTLTTNNSASAEAVDAAEATVWTNGGNVVITTAKSVQLTIVSMNGQIVKSLYIPAGTTTIGGLNEGFYIVKAGTAVKKIIL